LSLNSLQDQPLDTSFPITSSSVSTKKETHGLVRMPEPGSPFRAGRHSRFPLYPIGYGAWVAR